MNIRNVAMLSEMMKDLGFDQKLGYELLKRVSFRPESFVISQTMQKGKDVLQFLICFERKEDRYHFKYYDASLRKELEIPEALLQLDKKMEVINWADAFSPGTLKTWSAEDDASWKNEAQIESIISELEAVEDKDAAGKLKVKHWGHVKQDLFNLNALCSKYEINQRFYFFEGEGCIGADEAFKFLHNRWMEKQMLLKKKSEAADAAPAPSGNTGSLLPKKNRGRKKRL